MTADQCLLEQWYDVSHLPDISRATPLRSHGWLDFDKPRAENYQSLRYPIPILTISGGNELARATLAGHLMRYWIEQRLDPVPDELRFYYVDAAVGMVRFRQAAYDREQRSNFDNIIEHCSFLVLAEVDKTEPKDHKLLGGLLRQRRNRGLMTVLTTSDDLSPLSEDLIRIIMDGRKVSLNA